MRRSLSCVACCTNTLYDMEWVELKKKIDREATEFEVLKRKIEKEDANEI